MAEKFTIDEAISYGWRTFLDNVGALLLLIALPFFGGSLAGEIPGWIVALGDMEPVQRNLAKLTLVFPVQFVIWAFVQLGVLTIALRLLDGKQPGFDAYIENLGKFLNFLMGSFLYVTAVIIGALLLLVPGLIALVGLHFYAYLIVDRNLGPVEALKGSWTLVQGSLKDLAIFWLIIAAIHIAGLILFLVGLIPASIISTLAIAFVYRQLLAKTPELSAAR